MATNKKPVADQVLQDNHLYLWGNQLVRAIFAGYWRLSVLDRATGEPVAHTPGKMVGYINSQGSWRGMAIDASGESALGELVEIDFSEFFDIAYVGDPPYINGHIYGHGKQVFTASRPKDGHYIVMLYRFYRMGQRTKSVASPGDLAGYALDKDRHWHRLTTGDPKHHEQQFVFSLCVDFEQEIMSNLHEIAHSYEAYMSGH